MKAAPQAQMRLLDLQQLDTTLDRLAHRRQNVPEVTQAAELADRVTALRDQGITARTRVSDLDRNLAKAEGDVDQVRSRADRDRKRLDAGQVSSPKELESLQMELESLGRRQGELEDVVLELMEERETAENGAVGIEAESVKANEELVSVRAAADAAVADIDAEVTKTRVSRDEVAAEIPADLLGLYEKLRGQHTGVGAAALHRGRCEGCHLALNSVDLNTIRAAAPDDVIRCEECRRILVRTPESGL